MFHFSSEQLAREEIDELLDTVWKKIEGHVNPGEGERVNPNEDGDNVNLEEELLLSEETLEVIITKQI